jgi:hypothetical protein
LGGETKEGRREKEEREKERGQTDSGKRGRRNGDETVE